MVELLIAHNGDQSNEFFDVFSSCADMAKELCLKHSVKWDCVTTPKLTSDEVCGKISNFQMLFIAAHGDNETIYNENDNEVVSLHTTNYDFANKGFYTVSCNSANKLAPELHRIGLSLFVGYDDEFWVQGDIEPFCECALAGLDSLLMGETVAVAKKKMEDIRST